MKISVFPIICALWLTIPAGQVLAQDSRNYQTKYSDHSKDQIQSSDPTHSTSQRSPDSQSASDPQNPTTSPQPNPQSNSSNTDQNSTPTLASNSQPETTNQTFSTDHQSNHYSNPKTDLKPSQPDSATSNSQPASPDPQNPTQTSVNLDHPKVFQPKSQISHPPTVTQALAQLKQSQIDAPLEYLSTTNLANFYQPDDLPANVTQTLSGLSALLMLAGAGLLKIGPALETVVKSSLIRL